MYNVAEVHTPDGVFFTARKDSRTPAEIVTDGISGYNITGLRSPIYYSLNKHQTCTVRNLFANLSKQEANEKKKTLIEYYAALGTNVLNVRTIGWSNNWTSKKIHTFTARPGSITRLDHELISLIKSRPGYKMPQGGLHYITLPRGVEAVVFSADCQKNIGDIIKNMCWQRGSKASRAFVGMTAFVLPSDKEIKYVESIGDDVYGMKFTIDDIS